MKTYISATALLFCSFAPVLAAASYDYRVLSTTKTSTMEKEINEAAEAGFVFGDVMGGKTAFGGKEVVVIMQKDSSTSTQRRSYKLLATTKTSTMQKEMDQLGDEGFEYKGQTVFESGIAGQEVVAIMERAISAASVKIEYRLLATSKTSTMQKELREAGNAGFRLLGMTVAKTAIGGEEVICILRKD